MNVVGIIAEYNPMHNGHIYNIQKAKELTNADYVIVIMSGSFTEQGNISVMDKFEKATIAIQNGADMVIELPTIYAVSSAENFAFGAVSILNNLNIITHLAFGTESQDIVPLQEIANVYLEHKNEIIKKIKEYTKSGINSGDAYTKSLSHFLSLDTEEYTLPNNILAIEYIKALVALKSQIKPVAVQRLKSNHNDTEMLNSGKYASSTSIRNVVSNNTLTLDEKAHQIYNVIPQNTLEHYTNNKWLSNENLWNVLKYEITKLGIDGLKNIQEVNEGLENKLYKQALKCSSYNEFIFSIKSKRYTLSKIKRICIYVILGITKTKYSSLKKTNYARVLKVKKNSSILLSAIASNSKIPVITKVTDDIISNLGEHTQQSVKLDILAHNLFYANNKDYTNKIIQP